MRHSRLDSVNRSAIILRMFDGMTSSYSASYGAITEVIRGSELEVIAGNPLESAASTSLFIIRPFGPDPDIALISNLACPPYGGLMDWRISFHRF